MAASSRHTAQFLSGGVVLTDTGLAVTDSIQKSAAKFLSDTGATISDGAGVLRFAALTDTGAAISDSTATLRLRLVTDTGATVSDTIPRSATRAVADTGLTVTDSTVSGRTRAITDTGATITDSPLPARQRSLTDTGLAVADSIQMSVNRAVTVTGLAISDSIGATSGGVSLTDTGLTITDSIARVKPVAITDTVFVPGFAVSTAVLDDFLRPNENPLDGGGRWTRTGTFGGACRLVSNAVRGTSSQIETSSYSAAGSLADCEAWAMLTALPTGFANSCGVYVRQDTGQPTGKAQYAANYEIGALFLTYTDASGGSHLLGTLSITLSVGDSIGVRAVGSTISAYYKPAAGSWTLAITATDTNLAQGYLGIVNNSDFGGLTNFGGGVVGLADSLQKTRPVTLTDTGLGPTNDRISFTVGPDTGLTITTSLASRRLRQLTTTGLVLTDSLGEIVLTDTGLSTTDSLVAQRIVPRTPTDTGLTVTDLITLKAAKHFPADRGLTFTDDLVVRKNGGNVSVSITTVGLAVSGSIMMHVTRNSMRVPDAGLSLTDGIIRTVTPPRPPPGRIHANFTDAISGLGVSFTDTSTPGPSGPITAWAWAFGDGGTSSLQNPTHTYGAAGTYSVTLTVTGTGLDGQDSITRPVSVFAPLTAGTHIDAVIV